MEIDFKTVNSEEILKLSYYDISENIKIPLLSYPLLENTGIVKHCFSTRMGGVSEGVFSSMNLSFSRGDDRESVFENFRRLALAMGTDPHNFVFTDQTHTANIKRVHQSDAGSGIYKKREYADIDGLITNEKDIVLSTFFADCVPIYFVDPVHKAIGLSHSGWKGTIQKIGEKTILAMQEAFQSKPSELICAIGPSICVKCYEISKDVALEFIKTFPDFYKDILIEKENEKYQLDLWKTNQYILQNAGVKKENIALTNICTCCNPKLLFSHRASHGKRGNLGAFLSLK